ncbi:NAD(P)/FAD-dependent oxidoreductase [Komagataeibacter swingsii]|uniref:D-amino-acid oxidase n=1 Tax=Komagataeibacter swingsii TaxID=215220 RepID=A0A2V4RJA6_9PROT|nr:FAD-dependent oxidoreductase [Komagataeibacter swingsii]PYD69074.1 D-amino-acid oxidase [Komagataeibacter swingsii]GBQ65865.1 glycine/D-amino acid oxidase [Komagataeibacter swingsii DSM 16373]
MGPVVTSIETDHVLPAEADVVIIGGGIVGVSTAYFLARQGLSVVLCEKGYIGGEQSSRNWGWVRKNGRDWRELPLMLESFRIWKGFAADNIDTGFKVCGVLSVAVTEADQARHHRWVEESMPYQIGSRIVSGDEIRNILPGLSRQFRSALYNPTDARAEPQKAAPAIATAARKLGATVVTNCAVRGLDRQGGRICAVVTEKGVIRTSSVVLAGGAWSRLFLGNYNVTIPQLKVLSSVARTAPVEGFPETSAYLGKVAFRQREDGGYNIAPSTGLSVPFVPDLLRFMPKYLPAFKADRKTVQPRLDNRLLTELMTPRHWPLDIPSPFEAVRTLDPKPAIRKTRAAVAALQSMFPKAGKLYVMQHWGGMIDVMPDAVPVISPVPELPGLTLSTGFSGHGFGIGPGAGRLTAELVTGATPVVDPHPFRIGRFTDGSPIVVDGGF